MKKSSLLISLIATLTVSSALADESIVKAAGGLVHDFVDGMAPGAGGAVAIADIDGQVDIIVEDANDSDQVINKVEVSEQDINFILSHVRIRDGVRMYMNNCDRECVQAVNEAIVRTEGGGLSVVALNSIIEGDTEIVNLNSDNGKQYVNHVKIGEK